MPALTIPLPTERQDSEHDSAQIASPGETQVQHGEGSANSPERASSPPRPPVSPITPVTTAAELAPMDSAERMWPPLPATFIDEPPPVPVSHDEDNADAAALRSAILLLQIQREKSKSDIKTLEKIKQAALSAPDEYVEQLKSGRRHVSSTTAEVLASSLGKAAEEVSEVEAAGIAHAAGTKQEADDHDSESEMSEEMRDIEHDSEPKFLPTPTPQNIVRMPPINWAKYHVVGDSLDKMHEDQRRRPNLGDPPWSQESSSTRPAEHSVAAPYSPLVDRLEPAQERRDPKKL